MTPIIRDMLKQKKLILGLLLIIINLVAATVHAGIEAELISTVFFLNAVALPTLCFMAFKGGFFTGAREVQKDTIATLMSKVGEVKKKKK